MFAIVAGTPQTRVRLVEHDLDLARHSRLQLERPGGAVMAREQVHRVEKAERTRTGPPLADSRRKRMRTRPLQPLASPAAALDRRPGAEAPRPGT